VHIENLINYLIAIDPYNPGVLTCLGLNLGHPVAVLSWTRQEHPVPPVPELQVGWVIWGTGTRF